MKNVVSRTAAVLIMALVLPVAVMAGGNKEVEAPTLDIPAQPRQYISPTNQDGVQDVLQLPFSDVVAPAEEMVITEYTLGIFDADGTLVSLTREVQAERRGFFGNLFGGEKPRVEIPDSLTWDGAWNVPEDTLPAGVSNGDVVEDGEYTYQLTVIDDAGQFSRSAPFAVTVDNTAPQVFGMDPPEYTVFSPNGDNIRDTIAIPMGGSREFRWVIEVVDSSGAAVFTRTIENDQIRRRELDSAPPALFEWDGSTGTAAEPGAIAPEGSYQIVLRGTDRAGNTTEATHPTEIVLSLTAADLAIQSADGNPAFSPNGDGSRDELTLNLSVTDRDLVRNWRIDVLNRGQIVRTERGNGAPGSTWRFDGRRDDGSLLPDGSFQVVVAADMINGTSVVSAPLNIIVDTVAPELILTVNTAPEETVTGRPLIFGAGEKQRLEGAIVFESAATWQYRVSLDGQTLFQGDAAEAVSAFALRPEALSSRPGMSRLPLSWRGEALDGSGPAADGMYELVVTAEDRAGNRLESRPYRVIKDGRTPSVRLTLEGEHLSPLSGSTFGEVTFRTVYSAAEIIEEFLFEIINEGGRMVRSEYKRQPFDSFAWNGVTNGGTVVPDGSYRGQLRVLYGNGHIAESGVVGTVRVDRTAPRISRLTAEPRRFSPDGDGEDDTVMIQQSVVPGDTWTGRIVDENGTLLLERKYTDQVEDLEWDGRGPDGNVVADGDYRYILTASDAAGNATQDDLLITVGTQPLVLAAPQMRLSVRPLPFSPDGDGVDERVTISLALTAETEITSWSARILDHTGKVFKSFSGNGAPPARLIWDGLSNTGELVDSARDYPFEITVRDNAGNVVTESTSIATDILVFREGDDRLRIRVSSIHFAGNTADLFAGDDDQLERNLDTLRRLARILNRYPDREIIIEGHAAHIYLEGPAMQREQDQVLIPLSEARAREVMQALIILGVDRNRMRYEGWGGARPVSPHADRENLWKNRRVEFLLDRNGQ